MSSNQSVAELAQALQDTVIGNYIDVAVLTTAVFDWILTFPDETRIMWARPVTGAKVLFLLNRYSFIAYMINEVILDNAYGISYRTCYNLATSFLIIGIVSNLVIFVFQSLRVFAISGRMWQFAVIVGLLNIVSTIVTIFWWVKSAPFIVPPPFPSCQQMWYVSVTTLVNLNTTVRVCTVMADAIVVLVTIHHTRGTIRASREANLPAPLSSIILRTGILYFVVMLLMNIIDLTVTLLAASDYTAYIVSLMNYILTSHFLLNLQNISSGTVHNLDPSQQSALPSDQGRVSSIHFASIISNLGASLRDGPYEDDEDNLNAGEDILTSDGNIDIGAPHGNDVEAFVRASSPNPHTIREENIAGPSSRISDNAEIRAL